MDPGPRRGEMGGCFPGGARADENPFCQQQFGLARRRRDVPGLPGRGARAGAATRSRSGPPPIRAWMRSPPASPPSARSTAPITRIPTTAPGARWPRCSMDRATAGARRAGMGGARAGYPPPEQAEPRGRARPASRRRGSWPPQRMHHPYHAERRLPGRKGRMAARLGRRGAPCAAIAPMAARWSPSREPRKARPRDFPRRTVPAIAAIPNGVPIPPPLPAAERTRRRAGAGSRSRMTWPSSPWAG